MEVDNHINFVKQLMDKNEELSEENTRLKIQLENKEIECKIAKKEAQELNNRLSAENENLQNKYDRLAARLELIKREADSVKNSSLVRNFWAAVKSHSEQLEAFQDRNEELSRENIRLKAQLKDEEMAKIRAQQLSKEVSKESKYYPEENEKVNKESEHYRKVCEELHPQLTRIEPKADSVISSSVISDFCEAVNFYSEQLGALQEKLDEERQLRSGKQISEIPNDKAYVMYVHNEEHKQIFADNKVLLIQDSTDLSSIAANSPKEMFFLVDGHDLKNSNSAEKAQMEYEKVLSICQKWKELRPDGEIHVIEWKTRGLGREPLALFTSFHKIIRTCDWKEELPYVVSIFWPKYYKQLLSDVLLEKYFSKRNLTDKFVWFLC